MRQILANVTFTPTIAIFSQGKGMADSYRSAGLQSCVADLFETGTWVRLPAQLNGDLRIDP